jgi:hypothetical protein
MKRTVWLLLWVSLVTLTNRDAAALRLGDYVWSSSSGVGHLYARTDSKTWELAEADAIKVGAHLVTVNSLAENSFLQGYPYYGGWIGFTDKASEGTWVWAAGDGGYWKSGDAASTSYTKWNTGEPNNSGGSENYAQLLSNGVWNDAGGTTATRGIVEFPNTISNPGSASWKYRPGSGTAYALTPSLPWEYAQGVAQMWGGNLATVPDASVNAFLQSSYATSSNRWIGLTDRDAEGSFAWSSGSSAAYRNWQTSQPDGSSTDNYVELRTDGVWNDTTQVTALQGIAEKAVGYEGWRYNKATGHFYTRINTPLNWQDAETRAIELGGHLTTLNDVAENDWVVMAVGTGWIGYKDVWQSGDSGSDPPGRWVWADGDPSTFVSWNNSNPAFGGRGTGGEPNGGSEDHAEMNASYLGATGETRGLWNDLDGVNTQRNGIVERTAKPDDFPAGPTNWFEGPDGLFYALSTTPMTWEQANSVGDYYGVQLATVHSAAMNDWLRSRFSSATYAWLGISDRLATQAQEPAGGWRWADGSPLDYTNWTSGEPNGGRGENYGMIYLASGTWNDVGSGASYYAIYMIPEPSAGLLLASGALLILIRRRCRRAS